VAHEREAALKAGRVEIVEEDAADAARFGAVLQVEVVVAPLLELRVELRSARAARRAVPVDGVLIETVIGREIEAAAEPPGVAGLKIADVGVTGRHVGIARVDDERNAEGVKGFAG
jgi:hypothetical protein